MSRSEDDVPTGARIDLAAKRYFPMSPGDTWLYAFAYASSNAIDSPFWMPPESRSFAVTAEGDAVRLAETSHLPVGASRPMGTVSYLRTAEGWVDPAPAGEDVPATAARVIGSVLRYAEPFYPVGATRRSLREGNWGEDLDRDGVPERFSFEFAQVVVGFETLATEIGELQDVARIRTTTRMTLLASRVGPRTLVETEEEWFAPGIGLVRSRGSLTDERGVAQAPTETLEILRSGVGGRNVLAPAPDGTLIRLPLAHSRVVFDATRRRYYVSVAPGDAAFPNRIVAIDAATGSIVATSAVLGLDPYELALSPDGSALYVGIGGTGDVVRLALPGLVEVQRTRLPMTVDGQAYAEALAVSPVDPDVVVVSMGLGQLRPRSSNGAGVGLIRAGVLQPRVAVSVSGSPRHLTFGRDGAALFAADVYVSPPHLYALSVLVDGVRLDSTRRLEGSLVSQWNTSAIDALADSLLVGRSVFRATDLSPLAAVAEPAVNCRALATGNRLICTEDATSHIGTTRSWRVSTVDAGTLRTLSRAVVETDVSQGIVVAVTPGVAGQVAISRSPPPSGSEPSELWLFDSPMLR